MSASIYLKRSTAFVVWCFFCDELRGACDLKDIKSYRWLARQMSASIYLKRSTAFVVWRFFFVTSCAGLAISKILSHIGG